MNKYRRLQFSISLLLLVAMGAGCAAQNASGLSSTPQGNPKLDSKLNDLVRAAESGVTRESSQQNNYELVAGKVRVIVDCVPDRVEAAEKVAGALGTIESRYDNLLQVLIPPASLNNLAKQESIRFIRLPQPQLPGGS